MTSEYRLSELEVELMDWCQGLGENEKEWNEKTKKYDFSGLFIPNKDQARECLRNIDSLLRNDNVELQPLHFRLGTWHTARTHLIPLLITSLKDDAIVYQCLKVLVRLTSPLTPIVENRLVRLEQLQDLKEWFISGDNLTSFMWLMSNCLEIHPQARTEQQRNFMDLQLNLLKNILAIPDPISGGNYKMKLHDRCIVKMQESLVFETLCELTSLIDESTDTSTKYFLHDCFIHIFREETYIEDLFADEVAVAAGTKALQQQLLNSKDAATKAAEEAAARSFASVAAARMQSSATASLLSPVTASSSFASSSYPHHPMQETARLSVKLTESLEAVRLSQRESARNSMARHARFGSKYSISVRAAPTTANGTPKQLTTTGAGPDGEHITCAAPASFNQGGELFAARLVRNPFGAINQARMVTDSLASHAGKKVNLAVHHRVYFSSAVRHALIATATRLLDSGGWNALSREMLRELDQNTSKDLVQSTDIRLFMTLSAFFLAFHRTREKKKVKEAEIVQKTKEKEEERRKRKEEAKIKKEEEEAKAVSRMTDVMEGATIPAAAAASSTLVAPLATSIIRPSTTTPSPHTQHISSNLIIGSEAANLVSAPVFPNVINSAGEMSVGEGTMTEQPTQSLSLEQMMQEGTDDLAAAAVTTENAAASSSAHPAAVAAAPAPAKSIFIRQVVYDASVISSSYSTTSWKFIHSRIKLYLEDKPLPWQFISAAIAMYKEVLRNLYEMYAYGSVISKLKANGLCRTLFYDKESIELFGKLVQLYNPANIDVTLLNDLVIAIHYQCKLLELLEKGNSGLVVLEKRRRVVKKKKQSKKKEEPVVKTQDEYEAELANGGEMNEEELQAKQLHEGEQEEKKEDDGDVVMREGEPSEEPGAADASSPKPRRTLFAPDSDEEQEHDADAEVNADEGKPKSESDSPGRPKKSSKSSKKVIREEEGETKPETSASGGEEAEIQYDADGNPIIATAEDPTNYGGEEDEDEYEYVEEEDEGPAYSRRESEFEFRRFFIRFAHEKIISNYIYLLQSYKTNTLETNQMILQFFQRFSSIHLNGFFFQLRAFVLFQQILTDTTIKQKKEYDELRLWIKGITREFLQLACKKSTKEEMSELNDVGGLDTTNQYPNRHYWIELLFWKNMEAADKLLNAHGWFDRSRDRIQSIREAMAVDDQYNQDADWVDIDEDELEANAQQKRLEQERADGIAEEQEMPTSTEWINSDAHLKAKPWRPEEDKLLIEQYASYKDTEACMDILQDFFRSKSIDNIKNRLKKLGVWEKPMRAPTASSSSSKHGKKKGSRSQPPTETLATILDRHDVYQKVPAIDDISQVLRELIVELVQKDCRSTVALMLDHLKICRDSRARVGDDLELTEVYTFSADEAQGWDHDANEAFSKLFKYMGLPDSAEKEFTWSVPKHFDSVQLGEFITLLEATLDSPASAVPREEEIENDEAITRLLSSSSSSHSPKSSKKKKQNDDEEDFLSAAEQAKEAKRQRRLERERAEAAELAAQIAEPIEARPRRRRNEEIQAERIAMEREKAEQRRLEAEAEDDGEQEFVQSSETVLGETAVAKANAEEATPAANFKSPALNDYMAQKRQRGLAIMADRERKVAEASQSAIKSKQSKKRGAQTMESSPKRVKELNGKKRLRKAAVDSDEEQEIEPSSHDQEGDATETQASEMPAEVFDTSLSMDVMAESEMNTAVDEPDEETQQSIHTTASRSKSTNKKKARRIIDEDDDEGDEDNEPVETNQEGTAATTQVLDADAMVDE